MDGRPPVRTVVVADATQVLEARVLEPGEPAPAPLPAPPMPLAPATLPQRPPTSELVDRRRAAMMAMGGTVASLVLGVFAAVLGLVWPPAALIAVLGLAMGIWGLSSPRRNLALIGMLICCLAVGIGAFGGVRALYLKVQSNRRIEVAP
jgi:hypothetical protein